MNILVIAVDDNIQHMLIRDFPNVNLLANEVSFASLGEREQPDILLLGNADLCRPILQQWPCVPIIVVLESSQRQSIAKILDEGAYDCLQKPFSFDELKARMRAHIRRAQSRPSLKKEGSDLLFSYDKYVSMSIGGHKVFVNAKQIHLTKIEFRLLQQLMAHPEKVQTHYQLLQQVWGPEYSTEVGYLRVVIHQLRFKVEPHPSQPLYIKNVLGIGYTFSSQPTTESNGGVQNLVIEQSEK